MVSEKLQTLFLYEMLIYRGKNRTDYLDALKLLTDDGSAVPIGSKQPAVPTLAEDKWVTRWNLGGLHRTGPGDSRKDSFPANDVKQEDKQPHDALQREDFNPLAKYVYIHIAFFYFVIFYKCRVCRVSCR